MASENPFAADATLLLRFENACYRAACPRTNASRPRSSRSGSCDSGDQRRTYHDALLEALSQRWQVGGTVDQARGDRLSMLFAIQQPAGDVLAHRGSLLGATEASRQGMQIRVSARSGRVSA